MEPKPTYDIHTDPRNAIVTGDATLVVGPGRVSFHGRVGDLNPQAIADAWALAGALRNSGEAQAVPDVPAAVEILRELRRELLNLGPDRSAETLVCLVDRAMAALTADEEAG
jgi:hypothetical protein